MRLRVTNISGGGVSIPTGPTLSSGESCICEMPYDVIEAFFDPANPPNAMVDPVFLKQLGWVNDLLTLVDDGVILLEFISGPELSLGMESLNKKLLTLKGGKK